jgi:hypothetical protein
MNGAMAMKEITARDWAVMKTVEVAGTPDRACSGGENDLSTTAFFGDYMCFGGISERHDALNGDRQLAVAYHFQLVDSEHLRLLVYSPRSNSGTAGKIERHLAFEEERKPTVSKTIERHGREPDNLRKRRLEGGIRPLDQ